MKQSAPVAPPKPPAKPPAKKAKKAPAKSAVVDTGAPLCKPPLPPEAVGARARESLTRPMSAPSARLLLQLDECARIKAAFERRDALPHRRARGRADDARDRPKEQCEAALPGKGSKLVAAKLMAGLDPLAEAAAKKKGTKKKGGKKGGKRGRLAEEAPRARSKTLRL